MARVIDPTISEAIGSIKPWIRASSSVPIPSNWVICDGSLVVDSDSPFDFGAGFTVIDMRSRFARGHASLTNANFPVNTNYILGGVGVGVGGVDTHSHNGGAYSNGSHTHSGSTSSPHDHTISNDSHTHTDTGGGGVFNNGFPLGANSTYNHNHGGLTGSATPSINIVSDGSHGHSTWTDSPSHVPIHYGLVYIVRIK